MIFTGGAAKGTISVKCVFKYCIIQRETEQNEIDICVSGFEKEKFPLAFILDFLSFLLLLRFLCMNRKQKHFRRLRQTDRQTFTTCQTHSSLC